ncbi:Isochorismatase family protein YecD [Pseudovibrio sp. Ad5]|uniref:cysteine hydrolase family protein n=1 Tax=Pseudovibrio sp. Ad5 TaxID=989436 RepID=UPI0007AE4258|nr:cysteine hydrolase family protein [Pseudovibrio sp. Ad5]KZL00843.1 Isochorismatase family protein YecD [Pseudovibrio sp. Ad5]
MSTALIIIDVQKYLFDVEPHPFERDETIARINRLSAKAREADVPVIVVQHERANHQLAYGTDGWELPEDLVVTDSDLKVRKTAPDSFYKTNLKELLDERGITDLTICGFASEFCVDTTFRRAASLGFNLRLVNDAHTTHDKEHATGQQIREHHNNTLVFLRGYEGSIAVLLEADVEFAQAVTA